MSEVTRIPSAIAQGDPQASEQLLPLVYYELRELAAQKLAREKPGQTLEPMGLTGPTNSWCSVCAPAKLHGMLSQIDFTSMRVVNRPQSPPAAPAAASASVGPQRCGWAETT
jgi:hypothetical protein